MENRKTQVLVTGGAGFIGSHLIENLLTGNFEVIVLDNLSTGKEGTLETHINRPNFHFIKGDIRHRTDVKKALKNVDTVFHLAAIVSPRFSIGNPWLTNEVNITGTLNLLDGSIKAHVNRFVNFSSCAVYGDPVYTPINEEHPTKPLSPYAASKLASEHYCGIYNEVYGLKTTSLRFFNIYGPRQNEGPYSGVISQFIEHLQKGSAPIVFGDGEQTRDFLHVQDAIEAALGVLECNECNGEVINIGSGRETTINELANILIGLFRAQKFRVKHLEPIAGDIRKSVADLTKARRLLDYAPKVSLIDGLKTLVSSKQSTRSW